MYQYNLHQLVNESWFKSSQKNEVGITHAQHDARLRLMANISSIKNLFNQIYSGHPKVNICFNELIETIANAAFQRNADLQKSDDEKLKEGGWFLNNNMVGMSLYADRFCGNIPCINTKLDYLQKLGVNLLHIMPIFQSPMEESDGGYAVSDYRNVDERFGNLSDLISLQKQMAAKHFYLMLDVVFNHCSRQHAWAKAALAGDKNYQDYFYMFDDRAMPDAFEQAMPEVFPENAPGSFTYLPEINKWVMTVFHNYQWDLNFGNPKVFVEMLDVVLFMANLGVDILRIDAPAFIWKQVGTNCQNLPEAHVVLQLLRLCVEVAAPGMVLLAEAIVQPHQIMKYFGQNNFYGHQCELAYNATLMALQWDALATKDTRILQYSQPELLQKPLGTTWISYTRCHDDIGLGYDDGYIRQAGFEPYSHKQFLKNYYSGNQPDSPAKGALFGANPKNGDARISGTLASLCGLEKALENNDKNAVEISIRKIAVMQAMSMFSGGLPMLFYGDEVGYTNDYSYQNQNDKSYDNRWMHRPIIDWKKNEKAFEKDTIENSVFNATQKIISLRKNNAVFADHNNIYWLATNNIHVACFVRFTENEKLICVFNFNDAASYVRWDSLVQGQGGRVVFKDLWSEKEIKGEGEFLIVDAYQIVLLKQEF